MPFATAQDYRRIRSALRFVTSYPGSSNHYFVCSVTGGTSSGHGYTPDAPLTTLNAAIALCTAAKGDIIHVLPGHTEALTAAAAIAANISGISIQGYGNGRNRPAFNWTTAVGASFDISAANVTLKNLAFVVGLDAITAMFNVTGADVTFDGCEFAMSTGTLTAVLGILTAATATRLTVKNCRFIAPLAITGTTALITACIQHEVGIDYVIENNEFYGDATQHVLNATAVLGGKIHNNTFTVGTGTKGIAVHASSTPFITNNRFNVPSGTAPIVAAAGFVAGNIYSAAAGVTAGTASTF